MLPWQKSLRKSRKLFEKAAEEFPLTRLALMSAPGDKGHAERAFDLANSSPPNSKSKLPKTEQPKVQIPPTQFSVKVQNVVTITASEWHGNLENALPFHSEYGVVILGEKAAIERFRYLAGEAVINLPLGFVIKPQIFPTNTAYLGEESQLHRWAEFVFIASNPSWLFGLDPYFEGMRWAYTRRNAFGACADALRTVFSDTDAAEDLYQFNSATLRAILEGKPVPSPRRPVTSPGAILPGLKEARTPVDPNPPKSRAAEAEAALRAAVVRMHTPGTSRKTNGETVAKILADENLVNGIKTLKGKSDPETVAKFLHTCLQPSKKPKGETP